MQLYRALKYTSINDTIIAFLFLSKKTIIVKRNLINTFCYISITLND